MGCLLGDAAGRKVWSSWRPGDTLLRPEGDKSARSRKVGGSRGSQVVEQVYSVQTDLREEKGGRNGDSWTSRGGGYGGEVMSWSLHDGDRLLEE